MQALAVYRAVMLAAAIAPTTDQAQAIAYRLAKMAGETHNISARAWTHWDGLESGSAAEHIRDAAHAEAMGELLETASRDLARKHTTINHAAGRVKLLNTRERLQGFAADMVKGGAWELWGGGPKPAELAKPRKARAATWRPGLVKVAAEALEDGQAADFLQVAMDQLGGRAYMLNAGKPYILYAPDYAEGLPEGFAVARRDDGKWITTHMPSGLSVGFSFNRKAQALESGRSALQNTTPEKLARALQGARPVTEEQHAEALATWRADHGLAPVLPETEAQAEEPAAEDAEPMSEEMAAIVATAAAVAIGTAQAQAAETCAPGAADPRAYVAAAAVDLERLTNLYSYCATRRRNIEAGRRGDVAALPYMVETLQRIAQQPGHSIGATEARKTLQRLAAELAADAQAMSDQAHQHCGETQAQTVRMRVQLLQILATMGHACDAQGAADLADESAELVTCDRPELVDAAAAADTSPTSADAIGATHTPSADDASDCTDPRETRAQADDCTAPRETLASGAADASATSTSNTATPTTAQFLADIPQGMARAAFNGTSFSPERRGDLHRNAYAEALAEDYAHFLQHAQKGGTLDKLPAEFARYRARLAGLMRAYLASQSRCVSSFIAGPANFPAARMNKRADIAHRRLGEYLDTRETARRAVVRNLRPDLRPIMSGDADAADRLAAELAAAERWQQTMKAANAAIRKHAKEGTAAQVAALVDLGITEEKAARLVTPPPHLSMYGQGFASFKLTNNGANIRRMRQRLEMIERNKAADVTEATGAGGVRMEDDPPANRVRLFFPDKPAASVRDALKSAGYRWAPSIGAWQAYRNHWTLQKARELAGINAADLKPADDSSDSASDAGACDTPAADQADTSATDTPATDNATDCTDARETMPEDADSTTQDETPPAAIEPPQPAADPAAALRRAYTWHATDDADALSQPVGHRHQAQQGQRINSKGGNWRAVFYRIGDRLHIAIRARDGFETVPSFDSAAERVRALQHIGATLDATGGRLAAISTATSAPDFRALDHYPENLEGEALAQWFGTATSSQAAAEYWQDALDHINGARIVATRNALRVLGWIADSAAWPMTLHDRAGLRLDLWHVGAGHNVARVTWTASNGATVADDWSMSPELLASYIHAAAHPGDTPPSDDRTPDDQAPTTSDDRTPSADTMRQQAEGFTAEQCEQIAEKFEDQNHHGAALMWRCVGAQAFDLAARAAANIQAHDRAGYLTPQLRAQRSAIEDELRQRTATHCTEARETLPEATDCTTQNETPPAATTAPAFQRAKPEHVDLRAFIAAGLEPAQLVGVGVVYTGDAANAGGQGAIVSAVPCESRGVRVAVTLEDGRHMDHLDAYSFADRPGSRFAINAKIHGAPYLAELAAARAARVASAEAAKTSKEQHHAAELQRLAAEFPHLQRKGPHDRGGVFAARNIRTMLKTAFPGVKFSVISDYNSVRVRWTDGPTDAQVTDIIGRFDIGRSDTHSDYFYTVGSAWSDLFGGVQYLFTNRDESPELVARVVDAFNRQYSTQATPEDWRKQSGPFGYDAKDCNAYRQWFRQLLNNTDATPPAKTSKRRA